MNINKEIEQKLHSLSDSDYKIFNQRIISTNYEMLGIRIPALRAYAKELAKHPLILSYLDSPDLNTYESIILYGMVLANTKSLTVDQVFEYLDPVISKFDNWAHIDCTVSEFKIFKKNTDKVLEHYLPLKYDQGEFSKRFFVILLLSFYITDKDIDRVLQHLQEVPQGQYYVDMAIAWSLSVGFVKYYDKTLDVLKQQPFSRFVHNKAIQKARESLRITAEIKDYLNTLKMR